MEPITASSKTKSAVTFISETVCLLHACGVKGFVLGPERKAWASISMHGAQVPQVSVRLHVHTEAGAAGL